MIGVVKICIYLPNGAVEIFKGEDIKSFSDISTSTSSRISIHTKDSESFFFHDMPFQIHRKEEK